MFLPGLNPWHKFTSVIWAANPIFFWQEMLLLLTILLLTKLMLNMLLLLTRLLLLTSCSCTSKLNCKHLLDCEMHHVILCPSMSVRCVFAFTRIIIYFDLIIKLCTVRPVHNNQRRKPKIHCNGCWKKVVIVQRFRDYKMGTRKGGRSCLKGFKNWHKNNHHHHHHQPRLSLNPWDTLYVWLKELWRLLCADH